MATESTTETEPAQEPFVRFAAFRGKVPLPWVTVFVVAIVMAAADGFIVTSIQGAVASWSRDTAILLPVFVVAVMWAFGRAHRKHGLGSPAMRSWRRVITTALLIAAAGAVVGIAHTTVSAAIDYRLQSQQLQRTAALHSHAVGGLDGSPTANQAYTDGNWSPEQRETMALDVKAVGYGAGLILATNIVLVGWVVALRGGRLDVVASRRRRVSGPGAAAATSASPATA